MQIVTKMPYLNRVFNSQDLHIVGIAETHLVNDSVINVDNYEWFGNNRHRRKNNYTIFLFL
jgi:hypothetical protein